MDRSGRDAAIDQRLAKLPAWVRNEVERLRREVTDREKSLAELLSAGAGEASTGVALVDCTAGDKPLPEHARIRWSVPTGTPRDGYIEITRRGALLEIHGSDALLIAPRVTNAIEIGLGGAE